MEQKNGNITAYIDQIRKWRTDLTFCRDEVKILNRYLADVIDKNRSSEMKEDINHFQLRLSDTTDKAADLMQEVTEFENTHTEDLQNEEAVEIYTSLKDKIEAFCKSYAGLKSIFVRFLAKSELIV